MKRAALYLRVSTQEQAQEGYSIGEQKERLIAYCKALDWLITDVYVDGGYSGSNLNRPGIQKLMDETDKFDVVLVYKLDRLSRSQRDTLYLIEEAFLPHNVDFVSMQESFDTATPFGKAMIGLLAVFAQLEREQIKERTRMGRIARAKSGLYRGGGNVQRQAHHKPLRSRAGQEDIRLVSRGAFNSTYKKTHVRGRIHHSLWQLQFMVNSSQHPLQCRIYRPHGFRRRYRGTRT